MSKQLKSDHTASSLTLVHIHVVEWNCLLFTKVHHSGFFQNIRMVIKGLNRLIYIWQPSTCIWVAWHRASHNLKEIIFNIVITYEYTCSFILVDIIDFIIMHESLHITLTNTAAPILLSLILCNIASFDPNHNS